MNARDPSTDDDAADRGPGLRFRRGAGSRSLLARGDSVAFARVYEEHHQALFRYCRSLLRHDEDAQDALQSTMANAFAALRDDQRDFELRPWLFRIAHNEAISILRRRRDTSELDELPGFEPSLETRVAEREDLRALNDDMADLPERQRAAIVLRELNGLSQHEIALVLECSPAAVQQALFDARTTLVKCREGREMHCDIVRRAISNNDRRVMRARTMRAHLKTCAGCREFQAGLASLPGSFGALFPPLPAGIAAAVVRDLLPGAVAASGWGAAAGGGALATKAAIAVVAVATAAGGGAAVAERAQAPQMRPAAAVVTASPTPATTRSSPAPVRYAAAPTRAARADYTATSPSRRSAKAAEPKTRRGARHRGSSASPAPASADPGTRQVAAAAPAPSAGQSTPMRLGAPGHSGENATPAPASSTPPPAPAKTPKPADTTPGNSGSAPGQIKHAADPSPGNSGSAPGQIEHAADPSPGNSGAAPGNAGSPPGQAKKAEEPAPAPAATAAPETAPGNSGSAPGQAKKNKG
jgi:RNA polymerase sigma factor (sigma-70 family)